MRRAYGNTSVPVARSQEAIRRLILGNGGSGVAFYSEPPKEGFAAMIPIEGKTYRIRIVAKTPEEARDSAQEERRIWRVLFYHLKAVYEAANSGVMEFRELMLPFIVTDDGRTVAEHLLPELHSRLAHRPERLLPAAKEEEQT